MLRKADDTNRPLTEYEREYAERNHNLIYAFLRWYGYSLESCYDIAVFGYLKAVQIYNRREDLRKKYSFSFIGWQYMRAEMGNDTRMKKAKRRKPWEAVASLDAKYAETESLYNCIGIAGEGSPELQLLEWERLAEFWGNLSHTQRKIAEMKYEGYRNKEIYLALEIRPSTYYKEINRIKNAILRNLG